MIKRTLFISLCYVMLINTSWAAAISHPYFQSTRGGTELKAMATATWLTFIDVYDGALYAEPDAQSSQILDDDRPFTLEIRYKVPVSKAQLIEGAEVALSRQHSEQTLSDYQNDVKALHGFYQDVVEGDRFRLDIDPAKGLSLFFNDQLRYQNANINFARYYVGLWLAKKPLSESVRNALLNW